MTVLIWTFLALLAVLLAWEVTSRLRRWAGLSRGTPADRDPHYAPEAERRRALDAAASSADHASAVGLRARAGPRSWL
ncbi:MAG: hypothetical protein K9G48_01655 [Reyranella sp.]|nr:hypothetical protein [Reyranella sp.]